MSLLTRIDDWLNNTFKKKTKKNKKEVKSNVAVVDLGAVQEDYTVVYFSYFVNDARTSQQTIKASSREEAEQQASSYCYNKEQSGHNHWAYHITD